EPERPRVEEPDDDPVTESARQVRLGEEAFKAGAYGLAAHRFREASKLRPKPARPYFLLAQTYLALGKYHLAEKAIREGMVRDPKWPASKFRPLEMYDEVTEYSAHLKALRRALERFPDDEVLLFLTGYVLWFDGRQQEAATAFRKAKAQGADAKLVDAFLGA